VLQRDEGDLGARERVAGGGVALGVVLLNVPADLARIGVVRAAVRNGGDAGGDARVGPAHSGQEVARESRDAVFARGEGTRHAEGQPRHECPLSRPTAAQRTPCPALHGERVPRARGINHAGLTTPVNASTDASRPHPSPCAMQQACCPSR